MSSKSIDFIILFRLYFTEAPFYRRFLIGKRIENQIYKAQYYVIFKQEVHLFMEGVYFYTLIPVKYRSIDFHL
jgi:hypothetical protein